MAFCTGGGNRLTDVITAGEIFVDLILGGFNSWPGPGTEVFAREYRREVGGGAAITACGLARLGSNTSVMSVVGRDMGAWVAERLTGFGVDTKELHFDEAEPTAITVAVSMAQDRTFLTYEGANRRFPDLLADAAKYRKLVRARHLHLGWVPPLDTAFELMAELRDNGCTISMDTGWHAAWLADRRAMELLRQVDLFFPNEAEGARMTGECDAERILRAYEKAGIARVALKLGGDGAALLWDGKILRVAAHAVQAVDTTGAGDCFDAGFLHYWLRGENPMKCLRAANICGAISTQGYGGIERFPEAVTVEAICGR
jgi:sugar/nucleoside kinase (ribokinase family)